MATISGVITQSSDGKTLTFTDNSTGLGTVTDRSIQIVDAYGTVLTTIDMGTATVATYTIAADGYFTFNITVTDNTGAHTGTTNYLAVGFYELIFAPLIAASNSEEDYIGLFFNMNRAELFKEAAMIYAQRGSSVNAQVNINAANYYLNTPYCASV